MFYINENTLKFGEHVSDKCPSFIKLTILEVLEKRRKTLNDMLESNAFIKIVKGLRGTGKTTDSLAYIMVWASHQPTDYRNVRSSTVGVFKKTEAKVTELVPSFEKMFGKCFTLETKRPL